MSNVESDGWSLLCCHFSRKVAGREDPVRVAGVVGDLSIYS